MFRPVIQRLFKAQFSPRLYSSVIIKEGASPILSEDEIFKRFQIEGTDEASTKELSDIVKTRGIRADDPRITTSKKLLRKFVKKRNLDSDVRHYRLPKTEFLECVRPCLSLISQAVRNELIIPSWTPFTQKMTMMFEECRSNNDGSVATYIPQLARQNPESWGMSVCTVDGQRFGIGDSREPFCFQSVSKPFTYAVVSTDIGSDKVHQYIGQEPSGRLFNDICLDNNMKPHNPMVNAGAIICASLIKTGQFMSDRYDFIYNEYKKLAGGTYIGFDNATFLSERSTASRNFALAFFMKENNCFPEGMKVMRDELDLYFQLCSLETDCESAAVMAATLANGGVCPLTGESCVTHRACRDVLSLMYSCGMYDYSGQFAFSVGIPAKSGVSGGLILVIPNVMGICLYSPKLDRCGNSVRGVEFAKKMVECMGLHNYDSLLHSDEKKLDPRKDWTLRKDLWPGIEKIKPKGIGRSSAHEKRHERPPKNVKK
ncbi:unnamed protein product [Bursaphelenchus xylophilus]|uniref:glutaminase n=1 Tax=Bursaphelenchus xylophilus TaxID=6326 RepID=A0A1I7S248_BURXY|nr:unnamed protein product [Bursaphelenchus xylophilus]CAG9114916.1 unnamed protein product [Bursaphelenchus xylophilus]